MVGRTAARISVFLLLFLTLTLSSPLSGSVVAGPLDEILARIDNDDVVAETDCDEFVVSASGHARERGDGTPFVEVEIRYFGSTNGHQRESNDGAGSSLASAGVSERGVFIGVEAKAYAETSKGFDVSSCTWGIIPDPMG